MVHGWNMTDRKLLGEQNETPEDVATLYSWANLHGAKYRDFSASRAQTREKARQRMQEAIAAERGRADDENGVPAVPESPRDSEATRAAEAARQAEYAAQQAAQRSAQQAGQQNGWQPSLPSRYAQPSTTAPAPIPNGLQRESGAYPTLQGLRTTAPPNVPRMAPLRDEPRAYRTTAERINESREDLSRPAWLTPSQPEPAAPPVAQAPQDSLQGSRDRMTSRWFALKGVFDHGVQAPAEVAAFPTSSRTPVLAVFSLAGGVGKTSLVATLARALASRGERVLLVDTASFGLLPFFFGARDHRPGVLRTFSPPGAGGDAPIQLVTIDPDALGPEAAMQDTLTQDIAGHARGSNRVLVDLATASAGVARRILRMSPTVLVPMIPDMTSVVSVGSIEAFFRQHTGPDGRPNQPYYLLNQFDQSVPLHLDVREVLREQVGDRLLPFAMRRSPAVSEALAEGMTVMDYAPNSMLVEDFISLAGWTKNLAAPVTSSYRGVRWSER
jgi:cellulose synthase operon protein YhjQ